MSFVGNFTLWRKIKNVVFKAGKNISIKKGTISVVDDPVFNGKHLNNVIDNVDTNTQLITDVETNKQDKLNFNTDIQSKSVAIGNANTKIYEIDGRLVYDANRHSFNADVSVGMNTITHLSNPRTPYDAANLQSVITEVNELRDKIMNISFFSQGQILFFDNETSLDSFLAKWLAIHDSIEVLPASKYIRTGRTYSQGGSNYIRRSDLPNVQLNNEALLTNIGGSWYWSLQPKGGTSLSPKNESILLNGGVPQTTFLPEYITLYGVRVKDDIKWKGYW